jgi:hypothetical protein
MKKLFGFLLVSVIVLSANTLEVNDLGYHYNFGVKKCEKTTFDFKKAIWDNYHNGFAILDKKYKNATGTFSRLIFEIDGEEKELIATSSFGGCRLYEDVIVKDMDVEDIQYVDVNSYADKPVPLKNRKEN